MIQETGRIIDIKIINGEKTAVVECISKSACKSCSSNDNCGVGVVAKGLSDRSHHLSMPYKEGMEINESIQLLIENKDIVKSSMIVYIIPLIAFVLGSSISYLFTNSEPLVIAISLLSLFVGTLVAKVVSSKLYPSNSLNKLISTK
ncbi:MULTISPECIES: SoxR reducing system RseC family protein [Psychromonas]|uniref:SoxR reducing system RseC family protein n=1 Tax=Psychromonas TaxID=67572 RepID=UPI0004112B99|nr:MULTISPECIES: SoxR reducing system RseC family protein [Psychromonas]MBB1273116.1 SoxR reducing system RseC family protein [Psychromonas sp. SR45-3]